jgi:hypothetical protein
MSLYSRQRKYQNMGRKDHDQAMFILAKQQKGLG